MTDSLCSHPPSIGEIPSREGWMTSPTLRRPMTTFTARAESARRGTGLRRRLADRTLNGYRQVGKISRRPRARSLWRLWYYGFTRASQQSLHGASGMIGRLWSAILRLRRPTPQPILRFTVVMTAQCRDRIPKELRESIRRRHEGIVYFVGLTTGTTTLALSVTLPKATTTPGSVDVSALEVGKVVRATAMAGLQVVGQLHTHPGDAYHSEGDLTGMQIRYPGYFSIVVPEYGAHLPSFQQAHILMWTAGGFKDVDQPIKMLDGPTL